MAPPDPTPDPALVIAAISAFLLGDQPTLRSQDVGERSGLPTDVAKARWRALGFPAVADDEVAFTPADVEALQATQRLIDLGFLDSGSEQAFIRTTGRTFARLAEWQVQALMASTQQNDDAFSLELLDEVVPVAERIQSYVWRRHLVSAASKLLLREATDVESAPLCVGFTDIVGYTTRSRRLSTEALARMVDRFEDVTMGVITDHNGQVIKTIGDEVLFVTDEPADGARIALDILDHHRADESFPEVRIGMAHGLVLNRLGDVFGPVVNVASRLTSVAKPGRAVVDRGLADALAGDPSFRLRQLRRTAVKGYDHLEPWALKRPRAARTDAVE